MDETAAVKNITFAETTISMNVTLKKLFNILGVIFLFAFVFLLVSGFIVFQNAAKFFTSSETFITTLGEGNLDAAKGEYINARRTYSGLEAGYRLISWTGALPLIGNYTKDLGRFVSASGEAIAGIGIFFASIQDNAVITLFENSSAISERFSNASRELSGINTNKYPKKFREKLDSYIQGFIYLEGGAKLLKSLPYLAGFDSPRNYLILFQNDKELRPTGGFMTAYSIMNVNKVKFNPVASEDVYSLDAIYKPTVPAPEPVVKYLKGPYELSPNWRLRDMNWSPDFVSSMINFRTAAAEAGVGGIDGIVAVDTYTVVNILDVLGSVGVAGYGTFNNKINPECNCPQVIHELESFADVEGPVVWDPVSGQIVYQPKNADNRKKIIGPLMNAIIAGIISAPKEKVPLLISAVIKSLNEKHILFYMRDDNVQDAISLMGFDGKINEYDGDYLHINDANLGGRKSNLYVTQEVSQEIETDREGNIVKTVTLTYKNPAKHDGWLNSVLPNWVRVYVPKGSELITAEGLEEKAEPYEDLGKSVFAGYFQLRPEGISKVTFKYKLPMKMSGDYKLLIQKQPGTDGPLYTITKGSFSQEFLLKTDKEIKL